MPLLCPRGNAHAHLSGHAQEGCFSTWKIFTGEWNYTGEKRVSSGRKWETLSKLKAGNLTARLEYSERNTDDAQGFPEVCKAVSLSLLNSATLACCFAVNLIKSLILFTQIPLGKAFLSACFSSLLQKRKEVSWTLSENWKWNGNTLFT